MLYCSKLYKVKLFINIIVHTCSEFKEKLWKALSSTAYAAIKALSVDKNISS